ncbi:MAG: hypothetical protein ACKO1L_05130 [Brachymonas sp.]
MFHSLWMYTMNRCLLLLCSLSLAAAVQAQLSEPLPVNENAILQTGTPGLRKFPDKALRGTFKVVQTPDILIDGKRERLSPGSRIRDTSNRLVMSASITGAELTVNFVRNPQGDVHEVWILTELEAKQKIKTNTPANNFSFASDGDAVKRDDGKTPFSQLPKFDPIVRQQPAPK